MISESKGAKQLFDGVSDRCSRVVTHSYSSSFSMAIRFLNKDHRKPIHGIYGFVRFADEIVDSFHEYDKPELLERFAQDTYRAIDERISLNPILNSFQKVVNTYGIEMELIDTFLASMKMDLDRSEHDKNSFEQYVLGSAEVVGLMCLRVFTESNRDLYDRLKWNAQRLGSAFQKINFLRDLNMDHKQLGRSYFPGIDVAELNDETKRIIERDILKEFKDGYEGIKRLPAKSRFGVYLAYIYYKTLFAKIASTPSSVILNKRVRISNGHKAKLVCSSWLRYRLDLI